MPVSSAAGAEQAIERAQRAFEIMRKLPRFVRADILSRAAELLKARRDEFVRTIAAEAGKPLYDARGEVSRAIFNLTNAAAEARRQSGEEIPLDADAGVFEYQTTGADGRPAALADLDHAALAAMRRRVGLARHFPIGPILAIAPFNFPLNLVMHKVAPAIAVGNSVVLKPAPQTPLTARLLQQLLAEAGLPEGALELGGNGAVIVAEDADLELAAARCVRDGSGIDTPADLAGKRIGVREYSNTAALVVRGVLTDEYDPGSCGWTAGDIDHLERDTIDPRNWPAHGVRIQAAPGRTLSSMIEAGELDALIAYTPPIAYGRGVRRLFPDWRKVEQGYYARTQRFPIMHIMALRRDVADAHPDLPEALLDAFTQAKQAAQDRLAIHQALPIMLSWMQAKAESTQAIMGRDFWPYGLEANRDMLETQIRWSHQQGLIERRPALDELFVA